MTSFISKKLVIDVALSVNERVECCHFIILLTKWQFFLNKAFCRNWYIHYKTLCSKTHAHTRLNYNERYKTHAHTKYFNEKHRYTRSKQMDFQHMLLWQKQNERERKIHGIFQLSVLFNACKRTLEMNKQWKRERERSILMYEWMIANDVDRQVLCSFWPKHCCSVELSSPFHQNFHEFHECILEDLVKTLPMFETINQRDHPKWGEKKRHTRFSASRLSFAKCLVRRSFCLISWSNSWRRRCRSDICLEEWVMKERIFSNVSSPTVRNFWLVKSRRVVEIDAVYSIYVEVHCVDVRLPMIDPKAISTIEDKRTLRERTHHEIMQERFVAFNFFFLFCSTCIFSRFLNF